MHGLDLADSRKRHHYLFGVWLNLPSGYYSTSDYMTRWACSGSATVRADPISSRNHAPTPPSFRRSLKLCVPASCDAVTVRITRNVYAVSPNLMKMGGGSVQGLFPFGALANHSCVPNTFFHCVADPSPSVDGPPAIKQVLRTICEVKAGDELCNSYLCGSAAVGNVQVSMPLERNTVTWKSSNMDGPKSSGRRSRVVVKFLLEFPNHKRLQRARHAAWNDHRVICMDCCTPLGEARVNAFLRRAS